MPTVNFKKTKKTLAKKNDRDYDSVISSKTPAAQIFKTTANTAHGARCPIGRPTLGRNSRNRTETAPVMRGHGARWQDLNAEDQSRSFRSRQGLGRIGSGSTQKRNAQADAPGSIGNSNAPLSRVASRRSAPARFCVDKGWGIPADQHQPDQALGMGASWPPEHG